MSMSIQAADSRKILKAEAELTALQSLRSSTPSEMRNKYRLLSRTSMYLIASHYCNSISWYITPKWDMFADFDKALKTMQTTQNIPQRIMQAIDHTIQDQCKITFLKRLNAVLSDRSKSIEDKRNTYRNIANENYSFFDQIKHCIWVAHGANANAGIDFADRKIQNEPDSPIQLAVIKKMIFVLKQGYSDCIKHSSMFRNLQ